VINGHKPDRIPLFELIRNDAVIEHYTGKTLTPENGQELIYATFPQAVDATRPALKTPNHESEVRLPDGRRQVIQRWTIWTEHVTYPSAEAYRDAKLAAPVERNWTDDDDASIARHLEHHRDIQSHLGDDFFLFYGGPSLGLMGMFGEVGLEQFCYYIADFPELVDHMLERNAQSSIRWIEHLPPDHGIEAVFAGDDIAFKGGPLFSPAWFAEHYMPRMKRVVEAYHRRGIKVNFHSDGNLMPIMDGLVDAGIDILNPIETAAGMDIAEMHRRYPHLVFSGGIDVSNLLPFGTPQEVRDATVKAIEDSEGQILVGSSTELQYAVPLANFLAMRQTALDYRV
jgi:hypothetical protein